MNRKAFYHLLKRYLEDDCTEEEKKLVEQWYELLGDDDDQETPMANEDIRESIQRLWPSIRQQTLLRSVAAPPPPARILPIWIKWVSAAVILAGITFGMVWLFNSIREHGGFKGRSLAGYRETRNHTQAADTLILADGSLVVLEPKARLYYPDSFGIKREVYLVGNAFFKVTKNPGRPFYVYSRNIVTQVLGTSFFVKSDKNIEVSVHTGKVAVYEYADENTKTRTNEEAGGVILKPNQKVIYSQANHHFRTTLVEMPLPVAIDNKSEEAITELNFVFEETPIAKVLSALEHAYRIDMVMENETLANCLFSGDIKGQDLYDQLEIICQSVQAAYEIKGTRILIRGSGCETNE
jgi:Fe2+-dicitrate sensor, membrane component